MSNPDPKYPRGKLSHDDEGELAVRVGITGNTIVIDFGKHVDWIGFGYEGAVAFANVILENAAKIKPNA